MVAARRYLHKHAEVGFDLEKTTAFIEKKFGQKLPIIIHGLEYAWFDIEATQNANIHGEADIFLKAMKELGMC